jgi:hypothetical protein
MKPPVSRQHSEAARTKCQTTDSGRMKVYTQPTRMIGRGATEMRLNLWPPKHSVLRPPAFEDLSTVSSDLLVSLSSFLLPPQLSN